MLRSAQICKKMHYFGQFKGHNSGRKKVNYKKWPHFFIYVLSSVCDIHFCIWKCQNSFSWGPSFGIFWSAKYLKFGDESCEIRILSCSIHETYTLRKVKKQVLLSVELRIKFVWSHGLAGLLDSFMRQQKVPNYGDYKKFIMNTFILNFLMK